MTPDQFLSTMHRQRADQVAMRLALTDLAQCLEPPLREKWLQALQSRIAKARQSAQSMPADQQEGVLAMVTALDYLHRSLSEGQPKEKPSV